MLRKNTSLVVSENIINILMNSEYLQSKMKDIDASIESYQNGREHGHVICFFIKKDESGKFLDANSDKAFYICQYRKSDEICIYSGKYSMHSISEDAYSNQKFFKPGDFYAAALWLAEQIGEVKFKNV